MLTEVIAAELQIRLNCQMKCNEFYSFAQNEPELIKCARRSEKYNFTKKPCSRCFNNEYLLYISNMYYVQLYLFLLIILFSIVNL